LYDDTNPEHVLSTETSEISACAKGNSGIAYVMMARRLGYWRGTTPSGVTVTRFYAETYSSEDYANNYLVYWEADPSIGRPMLNIGPANTEAAVEAAVSAVCSRIAGNTYMGIYSGREVDATKLRWIESALDRCVS